LQVNVFGENIVDATADKNDVVETTGFDNENDHDTKLE